MVRDVDPTDNLCFLRVRSKKHEIMIAPDNEYILICIQNAESTWAPRCAPRRAASITWLSQPSTCFWLTSDFCLLTTSASHCIGLGWVWVGTLWEWSGMEWSRELSPLCIYYGTCCTRSARRSLLSILLFSSLLAFYSFSSDYCSLSFWIISSVSGSAPSIIVTSSNVIVIVARLTIVQSQGLALATHFLFHITKIYI